MNEITLTRIHNPIYRTDRDTTHLPYIPGQSLADIRTTLPAEIPFAVSLNGALVIDDRLHEVHPVPGDQIVFMPVLTGGSDGKMIGRMVGMIIVAIIAWYAAPVMFGYAAGSAGWAAAAAQGASWGTAWVMAAASCIAIAGGLVVNAVLPPPKPQMATLDGISYDNSQAYSWSPSTLQQQGITKPRCYGRNKLYGNVIGSYLESDGSKQYLSVLIDLGFGPFHDIPASGIKINDQLSSQFNGITIETRRGLLNQEVIKNFNDTVIEHSISQKITHDGGAVQYIPSGSSYDELEVELTFPSGLFSMNTQTGGIQAAAVDVKVELVKGATTIILSKETDYVEEQIIKRWSYGFWRPVTGVGLITSTEYTKAWVEVQAGQTDYGTNQSYYFVDPFHVEGSGADGNIWHYFNNVPAPIDKGSRDFTRIAAASQKVIRKSFRGRGLELGTWTVRVTRITADNTVSTVASDVYLSAVREVITGDYQYPRSVLVGIRALATDQLSGSLRFSSVADCLLIRVWDGSAWTVEFNDNPAWVLFDVLTQPVYDNDFNVLRYDGIDPARIDLPKFKEWADWCDVLCPDGKGGTEKRITFNGIFDSDTNLWDAAMQVCQIGGAALVPNGIKLTLAIDKPDTPVQLFSVGNMTLDSFTESFLPMEDRAAEIEADFVDSESDYERSKLTIVNSAIKTIASKVNLQMFGVTKPSEAWRIAMRRLKYNELIVRTVNFQADIDSIACTVGDVIMVQADVPQWGFGGRIVSATSTTVTLDQQVTIAAGKSYAVLIRGGDDVLIERTISNAPGTTDVLTVSSAFTSIPAQYDVYGFGEVDKIAKPFRVIGLQRAGDLKATISAIEYIESVYNVDLGLPVLPSINYSALDAWPTLTGFEIKERLVKNNSTGISTVVDICCDNVLNVFRFPKCEVFMSLANTPLQSMGDYAVYNIISLPVAVEDTYKFAIRFIDTMGNRQPMESVTVISKQILGKTAPPPPCSTFLINRQPDGTRQFTGTISNPPLDLAGFRIRYILGTSGTYATMTPLHTDLLTSFPYETNQLAAGTYTFAIVSEDTSGNISTPLYIQATLGDPRLAGVIVDKYPDREKWPDTKTNCYVDEFNRLVSKDQKTWADFATDGIAWAGWSSWARNPHLTISYETATIDVGAIAAFTPLVSVVANGSITNEINYSTDGSTWSGWVTAGVVTARYIKIRTTNVVTSGLSIIESMTIYLNANVNIEYLNDITTSALTGSYRIGVGNIRLPIRKAPALIKTVSVTLQNVGAGWTWELIDKNTAIGPQIKIYNASNALADCVIDAEVKELL